MFFEQINFNEAKRRFDTWTSLMALEVAKENPNAGPDEMMAAVKSQRPALSLREEVLVYMFIGYEGKDWVAAMNDLILGQGKYVEPRRFERILDSIVAKKALKLNGRL